MNSKRVIIASVVGVLAGFFCAYGTIMMVDSEQLDLVVTTGLLASIVYNRFLIGLLVGFADSIKLNPVFRGALIGAVVTLALSIYNIVDVGLSSGVAVMGFGIVYGVVADVIASKFS